jgi:hypothetical protein
MNFVDDNATFCYGEMILLSNVFNSLKMECEIEFSPRLNKIFNSKNSTTVLRLEISSVKSSKK